MLSTNSNSWRTARDHGLRLGQPAPRTGLRPVSGPEGSAAPAFPSARVDFSRKRAVTSLTGTSRPAPGRGWIDSEAPADRQRSLYGPPGRWLAIDPAVEGVWTKQVQITETSLRSQPAGRMGTGTHVQFISWDSSARSSHVTPQRSGVLSKRRFIYSSQPRRV